MLCFVLYNEMPIVIKQCSVSVTFWYGSYSFLQWQTIKVFFILLFAHYLVLVPTFLYLRLNLKVLVYFSRKIVISLFWSALLSVSSTSYIKRYLMIRILNRNRICKNNKGYGSGTLPTGDDLQRGQFSNLCYAFLQRRSLHMNM